MSDELITPITDDPEEIKLRRRIMAHRLRKPQPAINAPAQDSVPGAGSGDS